MTMKPLCSQLVRHFLGPIAEAEDLVNEDNHRSFRFDLGVDHERLDGAVAVLERNILVMAGRGFEASPGPVLRVHGRGRERKKQSSDGKSDGMRHGERHGEEFSHRGVGVASV